MLWLSPVAHAEEVQWSFEDKRDFVRTASYTPDLVVFFGEDADQSLRDAHEVCKIVL